MDLIIGAKYELVLKDNTLRVGLLVSQDVDSIFLKLSSGYNEGILVENIKSSTKLSDSSKKDKQKIVVESNPEILILHTGGTIASKVDYSTGAVNSMISPDELLSLYPELKSQARIGSELISNMPSDDMNFSHYNLIANKIVSSIKKYPSLKGIILTHGTDTLHYTSAALSFTLQNLPVPVMLVGSQRSSDRPSSDAASNLLNAVYFINNEPRFKEVLICMHESMNDPRAVILRGINARKMHSSKRSAFKPVNVEPLAYVNFESKKIDVLGTPLNQDSENLTLKPFNENLKIGWVKSRPGMLPEEFSIYKKFDALILEGTGLGHFPITKFDDNTKNNALIFENLKELSKKLVLVMTSQTIFGTVNLNVYSPARKLKDLGVLGHNCSMSPETAYIKLAWLLSNFKKDEIKKLYEKDFAGEIVDRIKGGSDDL